ncbi:MAG: LysM peptidoglycan-binding domain-containing protein [Bacteroidales bacterium]|jgi:LysM repeat protein|nr:LysM peptidoglycan-binding domain-containing protein [Bacteroidales bacterium]
MKKISGLFLILQLCVFVSFAQQESPTIKISDEKIILDGQKFYLHKVQPGQTLYSISKAYHVETRTLMIHNPELSEGLKAGATLRIPVVEIKPDEAEPDIDTTQFHSIEIRRKHTLYSLSKQYNVTIQEIYEANPGLKDRGLKRKDVIRIPKHSFTVEKIDFSDPVLQRDSNKYIYHEVKAGETLYSLSRTYKLSRDEITDLNPELLERHMRIGEVLKIPKSEVAFILTFPKPEDSLAVRVKPDQIPDSIPVPDFFGRDSLQVGVTDSVHIVLMLPFHSKTSIDRANLLDKQNKNPQYYPLSEMMVQFYEGFLLGISELDLQGKNLKLSVFDTESNADRVQTILKNLEDVPDLIIGPVRYENMKLSLEYGLKHGIPVLAPVGVNDTDLFAYPNLISIYSNQRIQNDFIASWLYQRDDHVVIAHDGTLKSREIAEQIQTDLIDYFSLRSVEDEYNVKLFQYDTKSLSGLKSVLSEQDTNLVISVSADEVFITSLINKLYQCNKHQVRLLGDRSWMELDGVAAEELRQLKVSYVSPMYIDYQDSLSQVFVRGFREEFLDEPKRYAFMGYDVAQLITPEIYLYGKSFPEELSKSQNFSGISMQWKFIRNHSSHPLINTSLKLIGLNEFYQLTPIFENFSKKVLDKK